MAVAEPEDVVGVLVDAWNRHDMAAFAGHFAADALFVNVVGMRWAGRAAIEASHRASHATMFRDSRLEGEVAAVLRPRADVAIVQATSRLEGALGPDGAPAGPRRSVMTLTLVRGEGGWQVAAAQNTDVAPGLAAPPTEQGRTAVR